MPGISFFLDDIRFSLPKRSGLRNWLKNMIISEGKKPGKIGIILTSDKGLLKLNVEFLKHDYYTDIMTFQDVSDDISGEIYISVDRVRENAKKLDKEFFDELHRVMAHGILHMLGYSDKKDSEKKVMRAKEDFYLNLRQF